MTHIYAFNIGQLSNATRKLGEVGDKGIGIVMERQTGFAPETTVVRASSAPRYSIVESTIRADVDSGSLIPGDKLPSEVELAQQYGVSRSVIRHAIGNLEQDGLVVRLRAKGTFITEPPLSVPLYTLSSFSEELTQRGLTASSVVLAMENRPLPQALSALFNVPPSTPAVYLERLRLGDDTVLGYDVTWVHPSVSWCVGLIDLEHESLFEAYRRHGGRVVAGMEREVRSHSASVGLADRLGVAVGSAVLEVKRVVHDSAWQTLDVQTRFYRGDRFFLRLDSPSPDRLQENARTRHNPLSGPKN